MDIFNYVRTREISRGLDECRERGGVIIDVRSEEEYAAGRIPGSVNIPLPRVARAAAAIHDRHTPLYVYCHSGSRSREAALLLKGLGFSDVTDIGGMAAYRGELEP